MYMYLTNVEKWLFKHKSYNNYYKYLNGYTLYINIVYNT